METLMLMDFLINNWEVIGLLFTNVAALFANSPLKRKE